MPEIGTEEFTAWFKKTVKKIFMGNVGRACRG